MVRTEAPADWRKPPETANPLHLQLLHQGSTLLMIIIGGSGALKIKDTLFIVKSPVTPGKISTRVSNQNRTILQSIYPSAHINSRKY